MQNYFVSLGSRKVCPRGRNGSTDTEGLKRIKLFCCEILKSEKGFIFYLLTKNDTINNNFQKLVKDFPLYCIPPYKMWLIFNTFLNLNYFFKAPISEEVIKVLNKHQKRTQFFAELFI